MRGSQTMVSGIVDFGFGTQFAARRHEVLVIEQVITAALRVDMSRNLS